MPMRLADDHDGGDRRPTKRANFMSSFFVLAI